MTAKAAHSTTFKRQGTSTAFTNEACTEVTSNTVFQVTNTAKQVLDPSVAVVVQVDTGGGFATVTTGFTIDPLFGKVTFSPALGASDTVRLASGSYLPTLAVAEARDYKIASTAVVVDASSFDTGAYVARVTTLFDLDFSVTGLRPLTDDMDPGAGTKKFDDDLRNGTALLVEVRPGGSGDYFRGWVLLGDGEYDGSVADLVTATTSFKGAAQAFTGQSNSASWGWGQ